MLLAGGARWRQSRFVVTTLATPEIKSPVPRRLVQIWKQLERLEAYGGGAVTTRRVTRVAAVLVVRRGQAIASKGGEAKVMEAFSRAVRVAAYCEGKGKPARKRKGRDKVWQPPKTSHTSHRR